MPRAISHYIRDLSQVLNRKNGSLFRDGSLPNWRGWRVFRPTSEKSEAGDDPPEALYAGKDLRISFDHPLRFEARLRVGGAYAAGDSDWNDDIEERYGLIAIGRFVARLANAEIKVFEASIALAGNEPHEQEIARARFGDFGIAVEGIDHAAEVATVHGASIGRNDALA